MALSQRRRLLIGRLRRRKTRVREGAVLVEGVRAVGEALDGGADLRFAVHSPRLEGTEDGERLLARLTALGVDTQGVDDAELDELSDTEHGQGVLAVCAEPSFPEPVVHTDGRYLVLDAIQDPGNLGTLVRVARAFALDGVLALDGTVDPWGPKAVRASAGMVFYLPVLTLASSDALSALAAAGVPVLVADASGEDVCTVRGHRAWALVVGNEGAGPRPEVLSAGARAVRVEMPGGGESLNAAVAGAILLYALTDATPGEDS